MIRTAAIILARLDSARLPRKQLEILGGKSVLEHVVAAADAARVDDVIVATTTREVDDELAQVAGRSGVSVFRGSLENVAERFLLAAQSVSADCALRVNGDSPFVRAPLLRAALDFWRVTRCDIVTNVPGRRWPSGLSVEAVDTTAMERCISNIRETSHREHVTKAFYDAPPGAWSVLVLPPPPSNYRGHHFAVDTPHDLARARAVVARLGNRLESATVPELIAEAREWEEQS